MSVLVNRVQLIGHVGQNPEVKYLDSGVVVATFSLATTEKFKDKTGAVKENTEWHNLVTWDKLAQTIEKYVSKGDKLLVEGKLRTKSWDKDGVKHYRTEILVSGLQFLTKKESAATPKQEQSSQTPKNYGTNGVPMPTEEDFSTNSPVDDLPF